jgi:hypothetical protein
MAVRVSVTIRAAGDGRGLVHYEFFPEGRTVNKGMYVAIVRRLRLSTQNNHGAISLKLQLLISITDIPRENMDWSINHLVQLLNSGQKRHCPGQIAR